MVSEEDASGQWSYGVYNYKKVWHTTLQSLVKFMFTNSNKTTTEAI